MVLAEPIHAAGGYLQIQGTAPTTTASVFTRTAAKSRAAGSNAALTGSFSAGAPAAGVMVQNTTSGKSSRAFVYKTSGGANWVLSQPCVPATMPHGAFDGGPTEVDTWASTDTVNVLGLIAINIGRLRPLVVDYNGGGDNVLYVYQCTVLDPGGVGLDPLVINGNVAFVESVVQREVLLDSPSDDFYQPAFAQNSYFLGGIAAGPCSIWVLAGVIADALSNAAAGQTILDYDVIVAPSSSRLKGGLIVGWAYLDAEFFLGGNALIQAQAHGAGIVYGSASAQLDLRGTCSLRNLIGTWTAALTFPAAISTGVLLNDTATGNSAASSGGVVTIHSGIATTVANLDAAAGAAGFGGTAFNFGGASMSKSL